jgi:DNA-binding NarL/FixJ family response regulator
MLLLRGGRREMSATSKVEPIRIGVLTDEPLRIEGFISIFEEDPGEGHRPLLPVYGRLEDLLFSPALSYLVIDLQSSSSGGVRTVAAIHRRRPDIRLIVIGPELGDELVMDLIIVGARAYLDLKAAPCMVRKAIEEVISGSIWAPRRLLSKLIDRLLGVSYSGQNHCSPHLTEREQQVLELILAACSNREIAHQLGIEERTVKAHVSRLMRKMGADNRIDLSMRALGGSMLLHVDTRGGR